MNLFGKKFATVWGHWPSNRIPENEISDVVWHGISGPRCPWTKNNLFIYFFGKHWTKNN